MRLQRGCAWEEDVSLLYPDLFNFGAEGVGGIT